MCLGILDADTEKIWHGALHDRQVRVTLAQMSQLGSRLCGSVDCQPLLSDHRVTAHCALSSVKLVAIREIDPWLDLLFLNMLLIFLCRTLKYSSPAMIHSESPSGPG